MLVLLGFFCKKPAKLISFWSISALCVRAGEAAKFCQFVHYCGGFCEGFWSYIQWWVMPGVQDGHFVSPLGNECLCAGCIQLSRVLAGSLIWHSQCHPSMSLVIGKARLGRAWGSLGWWKVCLPVAGRWDWMSFRISSNQTRLGVCLEWGNLKILFGVLSSCW